MIKWIKRIFAIFLVAVMIGLVILTIFLAVTGSRYFMASLYTMLGFPLLLYAFMFIYRMMH